LFGLAEPRQQFSARRLGDAIVNGTAEQGVVARGERGYHGAYLCCLVQGDFSGNCCRQHGTGM